jgi:SAM-dependent methyltransferase
MSAAAETYCCVFCAGAEPARRFAAREMLYGTRAEFDYFECAGCQSLQIATIPDDLAAHYPGDYYSYDRKRTPIVKRLRQAIRNWLMLFAPAPINEWATGSKGDRVLLFLSYAGVSPSSRILDVGCGGGSLLNGLARAGVKRLAGIDPFITGDFVTAEGVPVAKRSIRDADDEHDVIMFNHSLEHVPDPRGDLAAAHAKLAKDGCCMVRIPVAGTHTAKAFGADWYGLDPPRHLALPTVEGMKRLAERAGFKVERIEYDSNATQFIGSELYRRGIALSERTPEHFTAAELAAFKAKAAALNAAADGDQAAFFLRRV